MRLPFVRKRGQGLSAVVERLRAREATASEEAQESEEVQKGHAAFDAGATAEAARSQRIDARSNADADAPDAAEIERTIAALDEPLSGGDAPFERVEVGADAASDPRSSDVDPATDEHAPSDGEAAAASDRSEEASPDAAAPPAEDADPALRGLNGPPLEEQVRMVEAMLFASDKPLSTIELNERMPVGCDAAVAVRRLEELYAGRGVTLVRVAGKWAFRTASDLSYLMAAEAVEKRKLSRAAMETLAIIAYHQPVTRAEIEEIRGVGVSRGTVDLLMELEWIKLGRRRQTPGRPVTFVTTERFLDHFGLESTRDLPGLDELRQAGLLESRPSLGLDDPNAPDLSDEDAESEDAESEDAGDGLDAFDGDPKRDRRQSEMPI